MTAPVDRPSLRTRAGVLASVVVFLACLGGAWFLPGLLVPAPRAAPAAPPPEAAVSPAQRSQAALVAAEDERLLDLVRRIPFRAPAYTERGPVATTVLTARARPYGLADLVTLGAARPAGPGTVDVVSSVLVGPGALLALDAPGTTMRLASGPDGFVSIVGWGGAVSLTGTPADRLRVVAHDPVEDVADTVPDDGRAYLRVVGGRLDLHAVDVVGLGFWSGRTGGLAVTGGARSAAAAITDTTVTGSAYGLYTADSDHVTVEDSRFVDNAADGVVLHRGAVAPVLRRVATTDNGGAGVAATRGSSAVLLDRVDATGNTGPGVLLDGRPLADRPGPGGYALTGSAGYTVLGAQLRDNDGAGLVARDTDDLTVSGSTAQGNAEGIVVTGPSRGARVLDNAVTGSAGTGIAVRDGPTGALVAGNTVGGADNGVQVRAAGAAVVATTVTGARLHGVSFQGPVAGSSAERNTLAGQGTSALDTSRADARTAVALVGNDVAGWQVATDRVRTATELVERRPLVLLWALLIVVPLLVALLARVRRRRGRTHRHPYPQAAEPRLHVLPPPAAAEEIVTPHGTRLTTMAPR